MYMKKYDTQCLHKASFSKVIANRKNSENHHKTTIIIVIINNEIPFI